MEDNHSYLQPDLLDLWLAERSPHTQRAYRESIARFFAVVHKPLADVTITDLDAFTAALVAARVPHGTRAGQSLSPATRGRAIAAVKSLCRFAARVGATEGDRGAVLRMPKVRDRLSERILSEEDVRRLLAAALTPVEVALLRLLYGGGLRVAEACTLCRRDVQLRGDCAQIAVYGKGGKLRYVLLNRAATEALRALPDAGERLFPASLTPRHAWRLVKRVAARAGLPGEISPHWLRHAHASHALDRGAPLSLVRDSLGHASVATTSKYLHSNPKDGSGRYLPD